MKLSFTLKMAVASVTSAEEVNQMIDEGLTYDEISDYLQEKNPQVKGLSSRSVRRFCKTKNIEKKCRLTKEDLHKKIFEKQLEVILFTNIYI